MNLNVPFHQGAPEAFPFLEKSASQKLGLNKDEARALRKSALSEGVDFITWKRALLLSPAGLQKLAEAATGLKLKKARPSTTGEPPVAIKKEVKPAEIVTLRVVRCDLANERMMLAAPAQGWDPQKKHELSETVRVRVKTTEPFRRGMEIKAQLVEGYQDLYDLAQPIPRMKSSWATQEPKT